MTLREKLIVLRDKAGISQMTLAHQLGVSRQAVSRWESGDATPSMDKLKALAKIYGVSLDWLCSDASDAGALVQEKNLDERDPVYICLGMWFWCGVCVLEAGYSDFVGRCAVGRAVFNGFRKLLCSSKLYITAVILFSCIYTGFGGINGYLMRQGQTVQAGELFVFGMDSWIPQLIITVAFLILVNDIPFGKSGAQLQLIRSSRSRWLLGQTLSGFSTAAVYLILVELLFVVTTVRNLSFSDEWSQPVILAARLGKCTAIGIETAVRFPMSVLMNKSAWAVFGVAWLYAWLLYGFFCLILIVSNLKFHTNVGYMLVVLCLIFKRFLEYVPEVSLLKYISPCDVASISARPITAVNVIYTVLFFLVADWILWRAARRQMEQVDL